MELGLGFEKGTMNPPRKRQRISAENSYTNMIDTQPPKRSRPPLDMSHLSPDERQILERAAELLNRSLSELCENNIQHTSVGPRSAGADPVPGGGIIYEDPQPWISPNHWQDADSPWHHDFNTSGIDKQSSHPNGQPDPAGLMFSEVEDSVYQWPDQNSQGPSVHLVNGGNTAPTDNQTWFSVPTEYSTQAYHQDGMSDGTRPGTGSDKLRVEGVFNEPSGQDGNIPGPSESDVVELGWVDLKAPQQSPEWSVIELAKSHEYFEGDKATPKSVTWVSADSTGKELSPKKKRGPFQDPQLREQTSDTRKLKACVRCRMQKIRCNPSFNDPSGVCQTCQDVSKQKIHTLPCMRYKISEVTLYRTGKAPGLEFTFRWPVMKLRDISDWAAPEVRTIKVMSDVCSVPLELSVRKFVPIPQDRLKKSWMDGKTMKFKETTPYAIVNMQAAVKDMQEYINDHVFQAMEFWLGGKDIWVQETFRFARQYMTYAPLEERSVLADFFRLWFAVRRTATTEYISGDDTLDMEPEATDRSYPLFGKVPLPPVMIQQLDMVLTLGFLQPLRKKVLEDFQKIVLANKPKSWMTIYLITFMSLYSCARLTAENYHNARKHGLKRRFAMPAFISERHHAANVFLAHYHYCTKPCNPFLQDWKRRQTTPFAEMTTDEIDFILRTSDMVKDKQDKFRRNWEHELYEDDFYFVSQMFEDEWMPRDTVIDYGDETVAGVPLPRCG
ncbi:hypothetical protein V8E51_016171 [Hyaloscypha variabilis]